MASFHIQPQLPNTQNHLTVSYHSPSINHNHNTKPVPNPKPWLFQILLSASSPCALSSMVPNPIKPSKSTTIIHCQTTTNSPSNPRLKPFKPSSQLCAFHHHHAAAILDPTSSVQPRQPHLQFNEPMPQNFIT
jgi:hypothetical protein